MLQQAHPGIVVLTMAKEQENQPVWNSIMPADIAPNDRWAWWAGTTQLRAKAMGLGRGEEVGSSVSQ